MATPPWHEDKGVLSHTGLYLSELPENGVDMRPAFLAARVLIRALLSFEGCSTRDSPSVGVPLFTGVILAGWQRGEGLAGVLSEVGLGAGFGV